MKRMVKLYPKSHAQSSDFKTWLEMLEVPLQSGARAQDANRFFEDLSGDAIAYLHSAPISTSPIVDILATLLKYGLNPNAKCQEDYTFWQRLLKRASGIETCHRHMFLRVFVFVNSLWG
jgi:hypothetical protein